MALKAIRGLRVAVTGADTHCGLAMAACVVLSLLATGCAGHKVTRIADADAFQEIVINSDKPVLVDFYKGGCATCIPLDGIMDRLVDEYRGRAVVAKFETMTGFFSVPSRAIKQRHDIVFFPTAILFVKGQEKKRWIIRYSIDSYRKALNEYVPPIPSEIPEAGEDISAK